jgi:hypothetical protein
VKCRGGAGHGWFVGGGGAKWYLGTPNGSVADQESLKEQPWDAARQARSRLNKRWTRSKSLGEVTEAKGAHWEITSGSAGGVGAEERGRLVFAWGKSRGVGARLRPQPPRRD